MDDYKKMKPKTVVRLAYVKGKVTKGDFGDMETKLVFRDGGEAPPYDTQIFISKIAMVQMVDRPVEGVRQAAGLLWADEENNQVGDGIVGKGLATWLRRAVLHGEQQFTTTHGGAVEQPAVASAALEQEWQNSPECR